MDVVTLGETMVLFTPDSTGYMRYNTNFKSQIAGAESNVAIGLSRLGHYPGWMSRLGNDEFGKKILNFIRGEGVNVDEVRLDESAATGLYFKQILTEDEIDVQYYRQGSAASKMEPSHLNESFISKAKYLHITGITPALSESCYETVMRAIDIACNNGVKVVFDPNVRKKLWSKERSIKVLLEIAALSDIVLPGLEESEFLLGSKDPKTVAKKFYDNGAREVVVKLGAQGAYYLTDTKSGTISGFTVNNVVDPVGAGDGFAAGLLSGLLDFLPIEKAVERGNAIGAMATRVQGDIEGLPERDRMLSFVSGHKQEDVNR